MIIGIDASMLVYQGSGVANYTYNLIKNLLLLDKKNQYKIFFPSLKPKKIFNFIDEFRNLGGKIYYYPLPFKFLKVTWQNLNILPIEWLIGKCDVIFFSDFLRPPTLPKTKGITTIHDLTWKIYPQYHTKEVISAHQTKLKKTIKYDDEIIVDSENTKNDLLKFYPQIKKEKIHIIYPGIDNRFKPIKNKRKINQVLSKYFNLLTTYHSLQPKNFLLYVGAIEPRKNLDLAIKVFHQLITNRQLPIINNQPPTSNIKQPTTCHPELVSGSNNINFSDFKFLIIGRAGWKNKKIFQLTSQLHLQDKVIFLGYVKDEDLPYFYSGAKATIYLSEYEGFGLPPLESLICGTPVIAGDNSSLKEIVPQEFLVDIKDEKKILEKIKYLLTKDIKIDSLKIKKRFDWKLKSKKFLEIIKSFKRD